MAVEQLINQGVALGKQDRLEEAERLLRRAGELDPSNPRAHHNLGVALDAMNRPDAALVALRRALELRPTAAESHHSLAKVLAKLRRMDEAIAACREALRIHPDDAESHGSLARLLLLVGDFKRGWAEYEWRWKCPSFNCPRPPFAQPRWNGAKAPGRTILLHAEQGLGDTIQFARFAPVAARRCGAVIVQSPRETFELLRRMPEVADVISPDAPLPRFDFHAAMMSLPLLLNVTPKTIPADVPYVGASPRLVEAWRERLGGDGAALLRVGLAWAGRPTHREDRRRSLRLADLAPLAGAAAGPGSRGIAFYSLQKWDDARQAADPPPGMWLIDTGPKLGDFADAAALIANLDLVVSVDTAVAHLAGALGKPVWTLLPFMPDFRWMLDRPDTPWYPTMRLLRQPSLGDWSAPIAEAADGLARLVAARTAALPRSEVR